MITAIIIIGLAFYWLLKETDYMRVRLFAGNLLDDLDHELNFDGADIDYLADYELQLEEAVEDAAYQAWLDELYAPKYRYGSLPDNKVDPRDKWMVIEKDMIKRRRGEMLYQRGR